MKNTGYPNLSSRSYKIKEAKKNTMPTIIKIIIVIAALLLGCLLIYIA